MASAFFDQFLPGLAQSAAAVGPAGLEGQMQGQEMAAKLAQQQAHTDLLRKQTQLLGQTHPRMQALKLVQEGLAKDPNFLNTPQGQMLATGFTGHQFGQQHPVVAAPGSQVFMPGEKTPQQVPYAPHGFSPGSLAIIPPGAQTQQVPWGPKEVSPGARLFDVNTINPETGQAALIGQADTRPRQGATGPDTESALDAKTLDFMARMALAGDTSVYQNLGRGMQGARNLVALRKRVAELATGEAQMTPADTAMANAEFQGQKAAQRTLGNRTASFGMAQSEAMQMADLVTSTSAAFPRSDFPMINKALQAFETGTGDVNTVRFGAALNSFINAYSRAISPTGQPTVHDKEHAREMLSKAQSHEQVVGVIDLMKQEMEAAGKAPGMVQEELRKGFGRRTPASSMPDKQSKLPDSPMLKQSPLAQKQTAPTNATDYYDTLPRETQSQLTQVYRDWQRGARTDDELRVGVTAALGDIQKANAIVDGIIAKGRKSNGR